MCYAHLSTCQPSFGTAMIHYYYNSSITFFPPAVPAPAIFSLCYSYWTPLMSFRPWFRLNVASCLQLFVVFPCLSWIATKKVDSDDFALYQRSVDASTRMSLQASSSSSILANCWQLGTHISSGHKKSPLLSSCLTKDALRRTWNMGFV